jgi:hypothetical protein
MRRHFAAVLMSVATWPALAQVPSGSQPPLPEGSIKATDRQFQRLFIEAVPIMPGQRVRLIFTGRIDGDHQYWYEEHCKRTLGIKHGCRDVLKDKANYRPQQAVPVLVRLAPRPDGQSSSASEFNASELTDDFTHSQDNYWASTQGDAAVTTLLIDMASEEKKHVGLAEFTAPTFLAGRIGDRLAKGGASMTSAPCPLHTSGKCSSGTISVRFDMTEEDVAPRVKWMREYLAGAKRDIVQPLKDGFLIDRLLAKFDAARKEAVAIVFDHAQRHYAANDENRREILTALRALDQENDDVLTALADWYLKSGDFLTARGLNRQNIDKTQNAYEQAAGEEKHALALAYAQALTTQSSIESTQDNKVRKHSVIGAIGLAERAAALYRESVCQAISRDAKVEQRIASTYRTIAELRRALGDQGNLEAAESSLRTARDWVPRSEKGSLLSTSPSGRWALMESPSEFQVEESSDWAVTSKHLPPIGSTIVGRSSDLTSIVARVSSKNYNFWQGGKTSKIEIMDGHSVEEVVGVASDSVYVMDNFGSLHLWKPDATTQLIASSLDGGALFNENAQVLVTQSGTQIEWRSSHALSSVGRLAVSELKNGDRLAASSFDSAGVPVAFYFLPSDPTEASLRIVTLGAVPAPTVAATSLSLAEMGGKLSVVPAASGARRVLVTDGRKAWLVLESPAPDVLAPLDFPLSGRWRLSATGEGWTAVRADAADSKVISIGLQDDRLVMRVNNLERVVDLSDGAWRKMPMQTAQPLSPERATIEFSALAGPLRQLEALRFDAQSGPGYSRLSASAPAPQVQQDAQAQYDHSSYSIIERGRAANPIVVVWQPRSRKLVGLVWPQLTARAFSIEATNPRTSFLERVPWVDAKSLLVLGRELPGLAKVTEVHQVDLLSGAVTEIDLGPQAIPVPENADELVFDGWTVPVRIAGTEHFPSSIVAIWPQVRVKPGLAIPDPNLGGIMPALDSPSDGQATQPVDGAVVSVPQANGSTGVYAIPIAILKPGDTVARTVPIQIRAPLEVSGVIATGDNPADWWIIRERDGNALAALNDDSGKEFSLWSSSFSSQPPASYVSTSGRSPTVLLVGLSDEQAVALRIIENKGAAARLSECGGLCKDQFQVGSTSRPLILSQDLEFLGVANRLEASNKEGGAVSVRAASGYSIQPIPASSSGAILPYAAKPAIWLVPPGAVQWTEIRTLLDAPDLSTCQ